MFEFTTETKGLNTYKTIEFSKKTEMDSVGIGMLLNNQIKGMLSMNQKFLDDKCTLLYNISSKIVLSQYLDGKVNKARIIKVFLSVANNIQIAENYMLDLDLIQLNQDEIYVNVSTGETELLYYPVLEAKKKIEILPFFKGILFGTEFDQMENCEYVTSLINFMNRNEGFILSDFRELLLSLEHEERGLQSSKPQVVQQNQPIYKVKQPVVRPREVNPPNTVAHQEFIQKVQPIIAFEPQGTKEMEQVKEKKSIFGFKKKEPKIKNEKVTNKKEKAIKNKKTNGIEMPGIEIPGVEMPNRDFKDPKIQNIVTNKPDNRIVETQNQVTFSNQNTGQPSIRLQQDIQPSQVDFGETTILRADNAGETTILGCDMFEGSSKMLPYLLRETTKELILIDRDNFHLGKEKTYVNYCISDNSAISRSHADLLTEDGKYFIFHNNSLNHTYINDKQITSQTKIPIQVGDKIKLANEMFEFIIK